MRQGVYGLGEQPRLAWMLDRQLQVLIGKGGVGKTTLAIALGLAARRTGRRVLLAEVRAPRRIPAMLGRPADADGPLEIQPDLVWVNLTPQAALEAYAMRLLKFRTVYRAVFEQQAVRRFLRAIPSLSEILILGQLRFLLDESKADWVILDAPSTGPGALMLEAPRAVIETAPPGPLREGASWIQGVLNDPSRTAVHLAVLAEELPVSEAVDLFHRLRDGIGAPFGALLVNRVLEDFFPPRSVAILEAMGEHSGGEALARAFRIYRSRLNLQRTYLDRLRAGIDLPAALLPEITDGPFGSDSLARLADVFAQLLEV